MVPFFIYFVYTAMIGVAALSITKTLNCNNTAHSNQRQHFDVTLAMKDCPQLEYADL